MQQFLFFVKCLKQRVTHTNARMHARKHTHEHRAKLIKHQQNHIILVNVSFEAFAMFLWKDKGWLKHVAI